MRFVRFYVLVHVIKLDVPTRNSNLGVVVVLHMVGAQSSVLITQIDISVGVRNPANLALLAGLQSCDLISVRVGLWSNGWLFFCGLLLRRLRSVLRIRRARIHKQNSEKDEKSAQLMESRRDFSVRHQRKVPKLILPRAQKRKLRLTCALRS